MGLPHLEWFDQLVAEHPEASKYKVFVTHLFEAYNIEADAAYRLDKAVVELQNKNENLIQHINDVNVRRGYLIEFQTQFFDKASTYSNLILSAGYAAIFATWSQTSNFLTSFENKLVGLLVLISLLFFVMWEITKMIHAAIVSRATMKSIEAIDSKFDEKVLELNKFNSGLNKFMHRAWIFMLVPTLLCGVGSSIILVCALLGRLF